MKRPKWLGGGFKPLEQHPELPSPMGPLREFVYMDEVSVISLVASRRGAVPEAVTRSESVRDTAELSSKLAASAAVAKAEVGSKLASETTGGVTTVAKSVVQATFRDLRAVEDQDLLLRVPPPSKAPKLRSADDLLRLATTEDAAGWVVAVSQLERGKPLELEVELETDPLFRGSTVISEVLSIMGDITDLVPGVSAREMAEMKRLNQVLERLLAGLVPLRGRVVDYRVVIVRDTELIVHRHIVEELGLESRDLSLVGVAARDLFWKDLRLVLFSASPYTVFCRIGRSGLHGSWNPVKLGEALREIAPHIEEQLQQLGPQLQSAMRSGALEDEPADHREDMMRQALLSYGQAAASVGRGMISEAEMEAAGLLSEEQCARHTDVENQREAFGAVTNELHDRFELELSLDPPIARWGERISGLCAGGRGVGGDGASDERVGRRGRWFGPVIRVLGSGRGQR